MIQIQTLARKSEIIITADQAEKFEIKLNDRIGLAKARIVQGYRGREGIRKPSSEEIDKLLELGINFERIERDSRQEFIEKIEKLVELGVDVSKIKQKDTIQSLAKKSNITINRDIAKKLGINPEEKIGGIKENIAISYRGKGEGKPPTSKQVQRLLELGISLEKKEDRTEKFIRKIERLVELGVDISKITQKDTIQSLAKKSGTIITAEQAKKFGIDLDDNIGYAKAKIIYKYRSGKSNQKPTKEQVHRLLELGISLEKNVRHSKEVAEASIIAIKDMELVDKEDKILQGLIEKTKEKSNTIK